LSQDIIKILPVCYLPLILRPYLFSNLSTSLFACCYGFVRQVCSFTISQWSFSNFLLASWATLSSSSLPLFSPIPLLHSQVESLVLLSSFVYQSILNEHVYKLLHDILLHPIRISPFFFLCSSLFFFSKVHSELLVFQPWLFY
jgi:hypothetical protein